MTVTSATNRRRFLQYLAASPLVAHEALAEEGITWPRGETDPMVWAPGRLENVIKSAKDAIDVFDFEPVMYKNVPPAHVGYMVSGAGGESTLRANRTDFAKFALRGLRLRKPEPVDPSITLFGAKWDTPVFLAPTGYNKAFHPDAEIAVTKAGGGSNTLQILSSSANTSIEDGQKARNTPMWFQLYAPTNFDLAKGIVARVERAGTPALVITVDNVGSRRLITQERMRRMDRRNCLECHKTPQGGSGTLAMAAYTHIDPAVLKTAVIQAGALDWDFVRRLRDTTKMKFLIKGILDADDAALAVKYGFDGIIVSNHGGRVDDSGTSAIACLPDVIAAVKGKFPVLVDSGFRRGIDVVKALAMGATAVGIGKPYLWGLGAFGQEGVESVLSLLKAETIAAMAQAGAPTVKDLAPKMIHRV